MNKPLSYISLVFIFIFALSSCDSDRNTVIAPNMTRANDAEVIQIWSATINDLIKGTEGYTYTTSSRAVAVLGVAMYEAVVPGMPEYNSLGNQIKGLPQMPQINNNRTYHWPIAANAAAAAACLHMFESAPVALIEQIVATERNFLSQITSADQVPEDVVMRSISFGKDVASLVIDMEVSDPIAHRAYERTFDPDYSMGEGENVWRPEPPLFLPPHTPYWKEVNMWASSIPASSALPPPVYSVDESSAFMRYVSESAQRVASLSEDQLATAAFWNDMAPMETMGPSARWLAIAAQVFEQQNTSLDLAAAVFAQVAISMFDASVGCWYAKFHYRTARPVTIIRDMLDPSFDVPMFAFPSPDYISEHAVAASAASRVLTHHFGNLSFTDACHEARTDIDGTPRTYQNFSVAAREAAHSRIWIGANFEFSVNEGMRVGNAVAAQVMSNIKWRS